MSTRRRGWRCGRGWRTLRWCSRSTSWATACATRSIHASADAGGPMPADFQAMTLPADPTVVAPDGSDVRLLLGLSAGGMAHFELAAGQTARAVVHRSVAEIW